MFACVSFPISSFKIFTYKIPTHLTNIVQPGICVNAPINRKLQIGFVISVSAKSDYEGKILKSGSARELTEDEEARGLYLGSKFRMDFPDA